MATCVLENGRLLIRDACPMQDQPELVVHYWPTRFGCRDLQFPSWIWEGEPKMDDPADVQVARNGSGYDLKFPGFSVWVDSGLNGQTKAVRVDRIPFPCPKVRAGLQTRYYLGQWQKYLKTRGWVSI